MAENSQNNPGVVTNSFTKGMVKDYNETFIGEGMWTHARNAVKNSHDGQVGVFGNEPSNISCVKLPYTLIGAIHLQDDLWALFMTDDVNSEIGIFDESKCGQTGAYVKVVNSACLNFKRTNLITGSWRLRYDCERVIYWDDGLNPTRFMDIDKPPYKYTEKVVNSCVIKTYTNELDCEQLRIAPLIKQPCIEINKGSVAGTLPNGSYQACIAYTVNGVKVSDYLGLSVVQPLFSHANLSSSLEVEIKEIDTDFDEFELVLLTNINAQTVAKKIGLYSTSVGKIYVDRWDLEYVTIPITQIVVRTEPVEKTDAMYPVGSYLLRVGAYGKYKFNYQKQANQIKVNYVAVQYPADYYFKGGHNAGYMRDEQYPFFIRWVYNTGDKSDSYHIPGRKSVSSDLIPVIAGDAFETNDGVQRLKWQVENTATINSIANTTLSDGGVIIAKGEMGYWESTETYPANRPDIWDDLCGKPIRHHKFPDETVGQVLNHFSNDGQNIVILGVQFENISHPLDAQGNPINSIVGYEILRGSREGNKSIVGKGLLNNMREYDVPGATTSAKGLFQNYPYNDLRSDSYFTSTQQTGENGKVSVTSPKLNIIRKDILSFHSPEVSFSNPYLNVSELKLYQQLSGESVGHFEEPYKHPKFKQLTNGLDTSLKAIALAISIIQGVQAAAGGLEIELKTQEGLPALKLGVPQTLAEGPFGAIGTALTTAAIIGNAALTLAYVTFFGTKVTRQHLLNIVYTLIPKKQYAAQYVSHGFYNKSTLSIENQRRHKVLDAIYVGPEVQYFSDKYHVNNAFRNRMVVLQTGTNVPDPVVQDNSRTTIGEESITMNTSFTKTISSHYGALKLSIPSQYGQLESVKQVNISNCVEATTPSKSTKFSSEVYFGGDTYINRFTEKNTMCFFNSWLVGEPDEVEYDYTQYMNIPYPRFWMNSTRMPAPFFENISQYRSLDYTDFDHTNFFYLKRGHFYLFNSGVRDFFVESEVNLAFRDWEEEPAKRHYDPYRYTDLYMMFRSDIVKSGNYYKYDYSLSISKLFGSSITWGNILPRDYDPVIADKCYTYSPNRVIYSLPQNDESKKDSWRVYLANNYKFFPSKVTAIKSVNNSGALFMMKYQSPLQFLGVEQLKLDTTGVKVTIGDGALFEGGSTNLKSIVNVDESYEYGSNQGRFCTIGTVHGIFWVSQNQGKVFQYSGQLDEISRNGMKWWFAKYLPSELLMKYPDYPLYDNPVTGVGVQMMYDNTHEILYITKKDYKPLFNDLILEGDRFYRYVNGVKTYYELNSVAFEDASWTASYDPKDKTWVSFHDWKPTYMLPGRSHFMSVNTDSIWKHNVSCNSFCNYYSVDYPFEVEFVSSTGQQVNSIRNIEYIMEAYKMHNDCKDKFHVLDENFDQAIIYNSEQISGLLELVLKPKNNPVALLGYPQVGTSSIKINYSKEENKYRFNQFWDISKNRGEFISTDVPMFKTSSNGYQFQINPDYVNYGKPVLERKKFRHLVNRVWLRRLVNGNLKILFKMSNQKINPSYR